MKEVINKKCSCGHVFKKMPKNARVNEDGAFFECPNCLNTQFIMNEKTRLELLQFKKISA